MKPPRTLRPVALGAAGLLAAGAVALGATAANAAVIGPLTIDPAAGNLDTTVALVTSSTCPGGTNIQGVITGTGFPADGQAVTANAAQSAVTSGGGYRINLQGTLRDIANLVTPAVTYSGTYTITLSCKNAFGAANFGDFTGTITFSNPTTWAAASTPTPTATTPVPTSTTPVPTSTTPSPTETTPVPTSTTPVPTSTTPVPTGTTPVPTPTSTTPTPGDGAKVEQLLNVSVPAGSLTLSSATAAVRLPQLRFDNGAAEYRTAGELADVAVTDTRAGAPGFTLSGQVSAFTSGANSIPATGLGWTPKVKSTTGATATAGPAVAPGTGLATPRTLATGKGPGTAVVGADLALTAPASTPSGDYSATLTITAI